MDSEIAFWVLLVLSLVVYLLVVPLVALRRTKRLRKRLKEREGDIQRILGRLYGAEQSLKMLHEQLAAQRVPAVPGAAGAAPPEQVAADIKAPTAPPAPAPRPPQPVAPSAPARLPEALHAASPPVKPQPAVPFAAATAARPSKEKLAELEEKLGINWLNKIGTIAFVIGVALLVNYSMRYLGPPGKIALGYSLAAALLAIGVYGERQERYRIISRAVLGGGWALVYFTTYAMHNIRSVRLVADPVWGFILLFVVAAALLAHSLRYHSEVTTGFAYLLAFATIAVSEIPVGALFGSLMLAMSLAFVLRARRWYAIEPFAIAATYAVHWMWLDQVFALQGGHRLFPEFRLSVALLAGYWAVYTVSFFLRAEEGECERRWLVAAFLVNAAGLFTVLHHQSFHPELRFWVLLLVGIVYLVICADARRRGRTLGFVLASTLGALLVFAAIPYRYSGGRLELIWLVEMESLVVAGWRLKEAHIRRLGWLGSAALTVYVVLHDIVPRLETWHSPDRKLGWLLAAITVGFSLNNRLRRWIRDGTTDADDLAFAISAALATFFALTAAWVALPYMGVGVVWAGLAALALGASKRFEDEAWRGCGHGAALAAAIRLAGVNLTHAPGFHNVSLRLLTVGAGAAIFYSISRLAGGVEKGPNSSTAGGGLRPTFARPAAIAAAYTTAASLLLTLLIWQETTTAAIGLAWGLLGLALFEAAGLAKDSALAAQGFALLALSLVRVFTADLNGTAALGPISARTISVSLLALIYYYAAWGHTDSRPRMRTALLWFGTAGLAALLRFDVSLEWVAAGWAAMAVATYALGRRLRLAALRDQCYLLTLLVAARCAFDNFFRTRAWHFTNSRTATVTAAALLLYALFAMALLERGHPEQSATRSPARGFYRRVFDVLERGRQHLFFFAPTLLLTILVSLEVRRSMLTAAWAAVSLVVFLAVLKLDERAYRWYSLGLLLLAVGRLVIVDVWTFDALGRIISFMGLGVALLSVSFLYARHRELLRRVL